MILKIYLKGSKELKVPEFIRLHKDHGFQSVYFFDNPKKFFYGRIIEIEADAKQIDNWVDQLADEYIEVFKENL